MNMEESDLDLEKVGHHAARLSKLVTRLITSGERSKEATCGAIMAMANILVMMICIVVKDRAQAVDVLTAALSRAFRAFDQRRKLGGMEVMIFEINRDPEPPKEQPGGMEGNS